MPEKRLISKETKHLIYWWFEWLLRLLNTSYHIINRKAYHRFKRNKYHGSGIPELDIMDEANFF